MTDRQAKAFTLDLFERRAKWHEAVKEYLKKVILDAFTEAITNSEALLFAARSNPRRYR